MKTAYVSPATFDASGTDTANTAVLAYSPAGCATAWAPGTNYTIGGTYSQGGICYYVTKAYTSGSSFGATDTGNTNASYVSGTPTSRTIYTKHATNNTLVDFTLANLGTTEQTYFSRPYINALSQFCSPAGGTCLSDANKNAAAGQTLIDYLRGDRTYELTYYRERKHVLGDIVSSEARYVKTPLFSYNDVN